MAIFDPALEGEYTLHKSWPFRLWRARPKYYKYLVKNTTVSRSLPLYQQHIMEAIEYFKINKRPIFRLENVGTFQVVIGESTKHSIPFVVDPEVLEYPDFVLRSSAWHEVIHIDNALKGQSVLLLPDNIRDSIDFPNVVPITTSLIDWVNLELNPSSNKMSNWQYYIYIGSIISDVYVSHKIMQTPCLDDVIKKNIWNLTDMNTWMATNKQVDPTIVNALISTKIVLNHKNNRKLSRVFEKYQKRIKRIMPVFNKRMDNLLKSFESIDLFTGFEQERNCILETAKENVNPLFRILFFNARA